MTEFWPLLLAVYLTGASAHFTFMKLRLRHLDAVMGFAVALCWPIVLVLLVLFAIVTGPGRLLAWLIKQRS